MGKTLTEIAKQLQSTNKKVQLIYAFNGTGKTRLSRAFKQEIDPKQQGDDASSELADKKIIYYSAFTEDLFYWDNDLGQDAEPVLKIQPNAFTKWVLEEQGQDQSITSTFQRYTSDKLTPHFSADFSSVSFSFERGNQQPAPHIKISKGEESNFIWSVFNALLEQVIAGMQRRLSKPQLLDGSRTIDVAADHHHFLLAAFLQVLGELADRGRLAGALQTCHQHDGGRLGVEVDAFVGIAHDPRQFAMDDAYQRLAGAQRADDLLADRLFLDRRNEFLDHRQCNVGLEQGHANLTQGVGDVGFSQARFALDRLHDVGKAIGQVIKHGE